MSHALSVSESHGRRHRHRSPKRKMAESLVLILGVPALLFVVLALSVELIEYRPSGNAISSAPGSVTPSAAGGMRTSGRMPTSAIVEIPPAQLDGGIALD